MKKLLAIVLALMLLASVAFAESASVTVFSNTSLTMTQQGQTSRVDLSDLDITLALGLDNEIPTFEMVANNGAENLLTAVAQAINGNLVLNIEGMSRPISAEMSGEGVTGAEAQEGLEMIFASLDQMQNVQLPPIPGIDIPKFDLMSVPAMFGATPETDANGAQSASFSLPYEQVKMLLSNFDSLTAELPEETKTQLEPVKQLVNLLVATDSGFALEGRAADDGTTSELLVDLYVVQNGVTSDAAVGALYITSTANNAVAQILYYENGQEIQVGQFTLTSDPAASQLYFNGDIMGMFTIDFSLYPNEEGAQVIALAIKAEDETINASMTYGDRNDGRFTDFSIDISSQAALSLSVDSKDDGYGGSTGTLSLKAQSYQDNTIINLTSDFASGMGSYEFTGIENAAEAIDVKTMTDAENNQISQEIDAALSNFLNYLNSLPVQAA